MPLAIAPALAAALGDLAEHPEFCAQVLGWLAGGLGVMLYARLPAEQQDAALMAAGCALYRARPRYSAASAPGARQP